MAMGLGIGLEVRDSGSASSVPRFGRTAIGELKIARDAAWVEDDLR